MAIPPPPPSAPPADPQHAPVPLDPAEESVAGEEDPGAALDIDEVVPPPRPN